MPNQENPSIRPLHVRVTQELYMMLEKLADRRGYPSVSELVRAILIDTTRDVYLTPEDYREIARRVAERGEVPYVRG